MCHVFQVWDVRTQKLKQDLPGHADEVCFDFLFFVFYYFKIHFNKNKCRLNKNKKVIVLSVC